MRWLRKGSGLRHRNEGEPDMPERRFRYVQLLREEDLPDPDEMTMQLLWQIVDEGVLGASRHVELVHRLLVHLAEPKPDAGIAARRVKVAGRFVAETRGRDAPVVANAITWLIAGQDSSATDDLPQRLRNRAQEWADEAQARQIGLVDKAVCRLGHGAALITFDYSSTVAAIVLALHHRGMQPHPIVPESRAIAGGRRYLEQFLEAGIDVSYVLDAAMDQILGQADAVLLGCESLRCDGSLVNTVGSLPLAKLAQLRRVPVYGCTDLYKLDTRSYAGEFLQPAPRRFDQVLLTGIAVPPLRKVDTTGIELEVVAPDLVTCFLTEFGPVPPAAIWSLGRRLAAHASIDAGVP
jgi:translation initiation factor 2B subunit (eIF-2B alpha/beta/delta family)